MNIINNSQVLGSLGKDLVLNTLGKIYIRTGDRYYELDFLNKSQEVSELNNDVTESQSSNSDIIITKTISNIEYPGDNKFIISLDGKFYITQDGKFKNVTPSTSITTSTNKSTIGISLIEDMNVISRLYSDNLIVDFSTGDITSETLKVNKIIAKSINAESINITDKDQFVSGFQKIYFGPEVSIMDIDVNDDFTYFTFTSDYDEPIFKVGSQITNEAESFIGEVVESTYEQVKVRILSGDPEGTDKIILKADSIQYDETWGSIYNKEHNLRVGIVTESGDYSHLEFIIVSADVSVILKSGTFVKCDNDCTISTNIDSKSNIYDLKVNTLYLLTDATCINLTNTTHYFKTKSEFESAKIKDSDIAFIKETEQIYYNGLYVGGKSSNQGLPDNFKIGTATNGALIVYKDGIWQPSYDFATYKYVNNKLNELLDNAPDALDTLGEIAAILQQNANSIGDLLLAVTELSKNKVSQENFDSEIDRINNLLLTLDSKSLFTLIDSKATWEALKEVESKLETYATKNYVAKLINNLNLNQYKEGIDNLSKSISEIQLDINEHSNQINDLEDKDASLFKTTSDLGASHKELREEFNNFKLKFNEDSLSGNNIGNIPIKLTDIEDQQVLVYNEDSNAWINDTIEITPEYILPIASSSNLGGIKIGFTDDNINQNYKVQVDSNGNAYVNVPWTNNYDTNYYHTSIYNSGLQISNGVGINDMFVPFANASQSGVVSTGAQTFAGDKTFKKNVTTEGRFFDSSDIRLKNILSDLSDLSLDTILSIPRIRYKWKKDGSTTMIGTIAQPMVGKFDELLHIDNEGMYSVDYDGIGVIALEGVAKVKSEVDILKERIEYLETEVKKLGGTI